jgi:hypothetical protein
MPWPDIPMAQRPWRRQRTLNEQQFMVGEKHCGGFGMQLQLQLQFTNLSGYQVHSVSVLSGLCSVHCRRVSRG